MASRVREQEPDSDEESDQFFEEAKAAVPAKARKSHEELAQLGRSTYMGVVSPTAVAHTYTKQCIEQQHQETGYVFTDPAFPPDKTSLIKDWSDYNNVKLYTWNKYTWKRVEELYPQPIKVFNSIDPNDILQGELGDCYFLSSLSAIAENPSRIEKLFETPDYQPSGCYKIVIGDLGERKEIIIDDFLPLNTEGSIAFSRCKREADPTSGKQVSELWVVLLEKAWAKQFGSYFTIDAGYNNDVLSDLTGAPCKVLSIDVPHLWQEIYDADLANFIIAASTSEDAGGADEVGEMGLVGSHAYAVISAKEVSTKSGLERILKIRNPWGDTEWTGDWSDSSSKWTPELKRELNFSLANDGTFWMPFDKFLDFFAEVCICMVHDRYLNDHLKLNQTPGKPSVVRVTVNQPTHFYVSVCQVDTRKLEEHEDYEYSDVRIIAARQLPNNALEFVTSKGRSGQGHALLRDEYEELQVEAGEYLIYVKLDWPRVPITSLIGFSVYSNVPVQLANVSVQNEDFLDRLFSIENAKRHGTESVVTPGLKQYQWTLAGDREVADVFQAGYVADVYQNETPNQTFEVSAFHKHFENVALLPPYSGDMYKLTVKPGEVKTVLKEQKIVGQPFNSDLKASARAKK